MKVVAWAPTRISLFGGGSDLPVFYEKYGPGMVINMAINLFQRMEFHTSGPVGWFMPGNASKDFYQKSFRELGLQEPKRFFATYDGNIEGGLGTSASAAVCLVEIARRLQEKEYSKEEIAERAWDLEVNRLKLYGGKQDQYAAAFGGINGFKFKHNGVDLLSLPETAAKLIVDHTLLFYLGYPRKLPKVQEELLAPTEKQISALKKIVELCETSLGMMLSGNAEALGNLLDDAWEEKKASNSRVSYPEIDSVYEFAINHGAWGGKVCGSGGGGYMLFMAPQEKHKELTIKLKGLGLEPVDFSLSRDGVSSRIVQ